jgi:hypothetical protein
VPQVLDELVTALEVKFANVESVLLLAFATILDPRFKTLSFLSSEKREEAVNLLIIEACKAWSTNQSTAAPAAAESVIIDSLDNSFWESFDSQVMENNLNRNIRAHATVEVQRYLKDQYELRPQNPLYYWRRNGAKFPTLYELAKKYLCPPATSVPCEHIFSKSGSLISNKRNRLKGDIVNMIVFSNGNWVSG